VSKANWISSTSVVGMASNGSCVKLAGCQIGGTRTEFQVRSVAHSFANSTGKARPCSEQSVLLLSGPGTACRGFRGGGADLDRGGATPQSIPAMNPLPSSLVCCCAAPLERVTGEEDGTWQTLFVQAVASVVRPKACNSNGKCSKALCPKNTMPLSRTLWSAPSGGFRWGEVAR
jgi:hypothetical protein